MCSCIKDIYFSSGVPFELLTISFTTKFNMKFANDKKIKAKGENILCILLNMLPITIIINAIIKKGDHKISLIKRDVISYNLTCKILVY